jgi:hypothetical protein
MKIWKKLVLLIRTGLMRIRVHHFRSMQIRMVFRIRGFDLTKFTAEKKNIFVYKKIQFSYHFDFIKDLQATGKAFSPQIFLSVFHPGSGSGSIRSNSMSAPANPDPQQWEKLQPNC